MDKSVLWSRCFVDVANNIRYVFISLKLLMWALGRFFDNLVFFFLIKCSCVAVDYVSYLIMSIFVYIQKNESQDVEVEVESSSNTQQR